MDRKWLPLNALRAFEAAGQHLSFTAAANSLTVAQSAVSRHVIVLENFLGVALFERRPQQLVLTEAGRHILPVVSKSFDRIDQALREVIKEKGRPKRVLKVALPTTFAYRLAIPILRDFRAEHPEIVVRLLEEKTIKLLPKLLSGALDLGADRTVREARIALGGVATVPWRAGHAEALLKGKRLDGELAAAAADIAFADARPQRDNAFKVVLGKRTLTRALLQTAAMEI